MAGLLCLVMTFGVVSGGPVAAQDGAQDELSQARQEKAFYSSQQRQLGEAQAASETDLELAQAELAKQRKVVELSLAKVERINRDLTILKAQRGQAMEESYISSAGDNTLLYALVDSGSLSEFLRRGQYTIFLVDHKEGLVDRIDGEIRALDDERRDLITKKNALEADIGALSERVALLKLQLEATGENLERAAAREAYLLSVASFLEENDRDFVKRNEPIGGRFAFAGGGTEHGLGMSQYGAKGAAERGRNYKEILSHYYRGTSIKKVGSFEVAGQGESEAYVARVVAGEISASWPMETLKAQAIAARSYAYRNRGNQDCTPRTQACGQPRDRIREAVEATRGQVLTHDGQVVPAYYHSTSGGWTEHNENVWGGAPLPWLRGVSSPWETDSPHWYWESKPYSRAQMEGILKQDPRTSVGRLETVKIIGRGVSGRVTAVEIRGSAGTKTVSGPRFKAIFNAYSPADEPGLRSTLFGFR